MRDIAYIEFFEQLSKETPLYYYQDIFHENVEFQDPFHHLNDLNSLYHLFQKMFETLQEASFKVVEHVCKDDIMYIKWQFSYVLRNKSYTFEGLSHVTFKGDKAIKHIDYWDAASNVYEKLPIIGRLISFIKEQFRKNV